MANNIQRAVGPVLYMILCGEIVELGETGLGDVGIQKALQGKYAEVFEEAGVILSHTTVANVLRRYRETKEAFGDKLQQGIVRFLRPPERISTVHELQVSLGTAAAIRDYCIEAIEHSTHPKLNIEFGRLALDAAKCVVDIIDKGQAVLGGSTSADSEGGNEAHDVLADMSKVVNEVLEAQKEQI